MDSTRVPALLDDISPFVQAEASLELREGEEFMLFRPGAVETSTVAVMERALESEVAVPLLAARTVDEFTGRLIDCLGKFTETRAVYRVLQRHGVVRFVDVREAIERLRRRAEAVGGEQRAEDFHFAATTFHRAVDLAKGIARGTLLGEEKRQRDLELIQAFSIYRDIFQCSQYVLYAASERTRRDDIEVAISIAFDVVRRSALNAYAAVRERVELRKPPEQVLEPLPFDDEDSWLAGIAS